MNPMDARKKRVSTLISFANEEKSVRTAGVIHVPIVCCLPLPPTTCAL